MFPELDAELEASDAGRKLKGQPGEAVFSEEEQSTLRALEAEAGLEEKKFSDVVLESETLDDILQLLEANPRQVVPFTVLQQRTEQALAHDRPEQEVIGRINTLFKWLIDAGIEDEVQLISVLAERRLPDDVRKEIFDIEQALGEIRGYTYALPKSVERAVQLLDAETSN
jgi:hypothetical protein